jgi:hypothetical protein
MAFIYENLLTVAEELLRVERVGTAARRRVIATAYYAVFRRIAVLCATWIGPSPYEDRDSYDTILRSIDHKRVRTVLGSSAARGILGGSIGKLFEELQSAREWADYSSKSHVNAEKANRKENMSREEASKFIEDARAIIAAIDALSEADCQKLSVLIAFAKR